MHFSRVKIIVRALHSDYQKFVADHIKTLKTKNLQKKTRNTFNYQ